MGTPEIVVNWRSATFIIANVILAPLGATKLWFLAARLYTQSFHAQSFYA
jgi:hypothetical protein